MTTMRSQSALAVYDSLLGPTAAAYRNASPHNAVLAIACRALSAGVPSTTLRLWCISRGTPAVKSLAQNRVVFGGLVASARKRVALSSSLNGRAQMRMTVARRIVGCLLSPMPAHLSVSAERNVRARHALAIMGAEFLHRAVEDGFDSIVMSAPWLGVQMGCTRQTAARALAAAEQAGWIRKVGTRKGSPQRWRLATLTRDEGNIAWAHSDLVEALADGDTSSPFVEVLAAAAHPAVTYGEKFVEGQPVNARVGHFAWLVGLLDEAGVDPVEVGMTKRTIARYRKEWLGAVVEGVTVTAGLDAYSLARGSDILRGVAHDEYEAARAARKTGVDEVRERRAKVRKALATLLAGAPIPKPSAKVEKRNAWVATMTTTVRDTLLPDEMKVDFAKALASKMQVLGYPEAVAAKVAARIAGLDAEQVAA